MLKVYRKINKTITTKLQADTLFGIALLSMLSYFLFPRLDSLTIHQIIFLIFSVITILVNLFNDLSKNETKYALLDNVMVLVLVLYFTSTFKTMIEANSPVLIENSSKIIITTLTKYPTRLNVIFPQYYMAVFYTLEEVMTWVILFTFIYSLYGFIMRYDSRMTQSKQRVSLFSVLENITKANTADASKTSGVYVHSRNQTVQDDILEEIISQKNNEQRSKSDTKKTEKSKKRANF